MKAIITIAGMGIGVFNMLASQLGKTGGTMNRLR